MKQERIRTEYGGEFEFVEKPDGFPHRPYWQSKTGINKVQVWPPLPGEKDWYVYDVNRQSTGTYSGVDCEDRAFCVASHITRRDESRRLKEQKTS